MRKRRKLRLSVGLSGLLLTVVLATGITVALRAYGRARTIVVEANRDLMEVLLDREVEQAQQQLRFDLVETYLDRLANAPILASSSRLPLSADEIRRAARMIAVALAATPSVESYAVANTHGERLLMRRLFTDADRQRFNATPETAFVLQTTARPEAGSGPIARRILLDRQLRQIRSETDPASASYDPRQRGWFREALGSPKPIATGVYRYASTGEPGFSIAQRSADGRFVAAADIPLSRTQGLLEDVRTALDSYDDVEVALVSARGVVVGHAGLPGSAVPASDQTLTLDQLRTPVMQALARRFGDLSGSAERSARLQATQLAAGGRAWEVGLAPGPVLAQSGKRTFLLLAIPQDELLADAKALRRESILSALGVLVVAVPLVLLIARWVSRSLRALAAEADAVRSFDFSGPRTVWPVVREVDQLAGAMEAMKGTIRRFLSVSSAIAAEPNLDRLMDTILAESITNSGALGSALFLAEEPTGQAGPDQAGSGLEGAGRKGASGDSGGALKLALARTAAGETLSLDPGTLPLDLSSPEVMLGTASAQGSPLERFLVKHAGKGDLPYVAVPLLSRDRDPLGLLLLWFDRSPDPARVAFIEAFSSNAAVTLETRRLIGAQKRLFEAFIELIAGSIDAKSPYTGGHCKRVPELTRMLAEAACAASDGPFAAFDLSEERWEAVHVAAWLHDCGKVITPEYVVDKATKLETLYDRIHEVRTRFEVLKRDVWIRYHEACRHLAPEQEDTALAAERDDELARLDDDFAFVASCNQGGEFLSDEAIQRLHRIADRTWLRTLDDRLGVSQEELRRMEQRPAPPLPVLEPLLADRPDHRIPRPEAERLQPDNPWGFTLQPPEWLYDRGELHNLTIQKGTLTPEERYKINEHIVHTIRMLSALPFPKHMRDVAELAGGHHETLIGTGYPRSLRREQMSDIARMMAIADIFEALTAADRPYKPAKTLSQALRIMAFMRNDQHIDPDLFELFIRSGVYRRYAEQYLQPQQRDAVDEQALLAGA
ncbi:chemotaxis sensory transducer family protein [Cyanobium sp. PCC 7001]|uniref:HD domain-containing phosphohydrolase n=1 Tax=Cyanobium sp. PCC 7001 TaxID=180281 RepID=UPI00018051EA|nr:HD domain-containing phosphohydrolase [Cyanobium sp. PCC 7001]EDY37402.1 chemotaxis sensory transducer family protein [Cyanobium sp. PCC 7001]